MSIASAIVGLADLAVESVGSLFDASERRRLAERSKAKQLQAEAAKNAALFAGTDESIAELERESDRLAAKHVDACAPLQIEKQQVEQRLLDLCATGQSAGHEVEEAIRQRSGILLDIDGRTAALDKVVKELREKIDRLSAEKVNLASRGIMPKLYDNDLVDTASEPRRLRYVVAQSGLAWARRRLQHAENGPQRGLAMDLPIHSEAEFEAERVAAAEALRQAESVAAAARQACIDE